jgi:TolB protein
MMPLLLANRIRSFAALAAGTFVVVTVSAGQQQPPVPTPQSQQPSEVSTTITGDQQGMAPRLAVPDFIALSTDAETVDAAKTIGRVLWDDLNFEREFYLIPRDVVATVPAATSVATVPFDRWRELNADGVIVGTVQKTPSGVEIEVRLFHVRTGQSAFATKYAGSVASKRAYAHRVSDDIHRQQRNLQGVAQTKLTFSSDRSGERLGGSVDNRGVREIMIADYDGENAIRVTTDRSLNIAPVWSPDARSIAYTSYRRVQPNIFVANIYEGTGGLLTDGKSQNWLPAWSPDGTRIAFSSMRDGNAEIYVMNRDGSNLRRLTNNRADDITPTWSPNGTHIAFTSDRTGVSQIWEMDRDGLGQRQLTRESKADRATWSLAPFNQIAFAAQTGPGNDIKILDMTTGTVRQLTFGEGTNESPVFAPNGRHIAFISTRAGKEQIFTMDTDGKNVRQVTRTSSNKYPNWSQGPRN